MYAQDSDLTSYGELSLVKTADRLECFIPHDECDVTCVPAMEIGSLKFLLEHYPPARPPDSEIKQMIAHYYDVVCSNSDNLSLQNQEITRYAATLDEFASQLVSSCIGVKPLNILSIGVGRARREELIVRNFRRGISSFIVNDASKNMCVKAGEIGFDFLYGFWQDFVIRDQLVALDLIFALDCSEYLTSMVEAHRFMRNASAALGKDGFMLIDFHNIEDETGWGKSLKDAFTSEILAEKGYELGECFFRRSDLSEICYSRHFACEQIIELIKLNGLDLVAIEYLAKSTGEIIENLDPRAGSFILLLRKL
jgi:SAM-dependent methyltransferase